MLIFIYLFFKKGTHLGPSQIGGGDPASAPEKKAWARAPSGAQRGLPRHDFPVSHDTSV